MMRTLVDVEQYHFLQRDSVSSLHERLNKGDKIVCGFLDTPRILDWSNDYIRNMWSPSSKRA